MSFRLPEMALTISELVEAPASPLASRADRSAGDSIVLPSTPLKLHETAKEEFAESLDIPCRRSETFGNRLKSVRGACRTLEESPSQSP